MSTRTAGAKAFWIVEADGWITVAFAPWSAELIASIKGNIPYGVRRYNPDQKTWSVAPIAWDRMQRTLLSLGYDVPDRPANMALTVGKSGGCHATLFVAPDAPLEVIKAAWLVLSRKYHPDNLETGDPQRMLALNLAYEEAKKLQERIHA